MFENRIFIGTSGWNYAHLSKTFYSNLKKNEHKLQHYSKFFNTVEVNSTFYKFFSSKVFEKWKDLVPNNFIYSFKCHKSITHVKKLKNINEVLQLFFQQIKCFEKKSVVLFQFPASFIKNDINFVLLKNLTENIKNYKFFYAFELRHISWQGDELFNFLKQNNISLVYSHSKTYPLLDVQTADFVYFRMHGPDKLYASEYSIDDLRNLAIKIKSYSKKNLTVFCYFNNDFNGYAVKNALLLKELLINF